MKQDHLKLAKRHAGHLDREQIKELSAWTQSRALELLLLQYADKKVLQRLSKFKGLLKIKGKWIRFKRFKSL